MPDELIGIIGGTGLGDILAERLIDAEQCTLDTPFGKPSCDILIGQIGNKKVAFINRHGTGHALSPSLVPFAANIFALKKIGVRTLISTGAVGSLAEQMKPGELVLVDQFIDKTYRRKSSFFDGLGAIHCEMAEPVCKRSGEILLHATQESGLKVHPKGTYVCMEGPQFSTRAEALMHKKWGGDLIGMTAMPEAKLAREAQMCFAFVALVSDYDCWREHKGSKGELIKEIIANLDTAMENCRKLLEKALENKSFFTDDKCSCRKSLELAVWSNEDKISKEQREKLSILFE